MMELVYELSSDLTEGLADLESRQGKIKFAQKLMRQAVNAKVAPVPELRDGLEWFNAAQPLSLRRHLADKLVLLDFFTYCCINCLHVLPEIKKLEHKYKVEDGLVVVGVHSAKFEAEKDSKNVGSAVLRHEILHPVVNDGMVLWEQLQIACWPSLLLIGPGNIPLFVLMGEGHTATLDLLIEAALDFFGDKISKRVLPEITPHAHLAPSSGLRFPGRVAVHEGKLLVADSGHHRLLLVNAGSGHVESFIGCGESGLRDGPFHLASFFFPQGVVFLNSTTAFVADTENNAIRKIDFSSGQVITVVGTGKLGSDRVGGVQPATKQALCSPWGLSFDKKKKILFIAMAGNHQIWGLALEDVTIWKKSLKKGACMALAGSGREENRNNLYPQMAAFAQPSGLALCGAKADVLLIADSESSSIRKVAIDSGAVSAEVGGDPNPVNLFSFGDKGGKGYEAKLQHPLDVCWSGALDMAVVADTFNDNIKLIDVAKSTCQRLQLNPLNLSLKEPGGICFDDATGRIFVADTNNHLIRTVEIHSWKLSEFPLTFATEVDSSTKYLNTIEKYVEVSDEGAKLTFASTIRFQGSLKASDEAPQIWNFDLKGGFLCEETKGNLLLAGEGKELNMSAVVKATAAKIDESFICLMKIVTCGDGQCKMETLKVAVKVGRKQGAPESAHISCEFEM